MGEDNRNSRIRIAYLIDSITCDTAGTQKQLIETIRRLDKVRFEPCIICLWQSEWMVQNELPCPCVILGYRGFLKFSFFRVIKKLSSAITERKFHIIQTFFEDSIFVGFLGKVVARQPLILLSSRRDMGLGKKNEPWYYALYSLALPWVNCFFDGIISNSVQVKLYVAKKERTNPTKIKVIYNGVIIEDRATVPHALFVRGDRDILIGMVASLTAVKRHDVLIRAVAELRRQCPQHKFYVQLIGEGPEYDKIMDLVAELNLQDYIHFVGAIKNVQPYLYNLDIGVLCSDREGLSNAILEYMACELPVVATSVGGSVEMVDETNGICFPPGDHCALAESLKKLIEDEPLRKSLGKESLNKIKKSYSWEKNLSELEGYYLSLVKNE